MSHLLNTEQLKALMLDLEAATTDAERITLMMTALQSVTEDLYQLSHHD